MKFRKELLVFSLILIFMLMSAVSAEENMTLDDAITSDYVELDSNQGYDISDDSITEDNEIDDDKNSSQEDIELDISPDAVELNDASANSGFNVIAKGSAASASSSFNKDFAMHKSSSYPKYYNAYSFNERSNDETFSNFQTPDTMGLDALNNIANDISGKDLSWPTDSSYSEYFDYLKLDSLKNMIDESDIGDVFNANADIIDLKTIDSLKENIIGFMDAGAKYADFSSLVDINAFFDFFDKIMNMPTTHDTMANIPTYNNPTLRNQKDYPDYGFYLDADSIMDSFDLNDDEELIMESDGNISDILIVHDNVELINQTSDLKAMHDIHIDSYDDMKPDLQASNAGDYRHDTYSNSDEIIEMQGLRLSQQINCLSDNMSKDIKYPFNHIIGCECTNTSFTKQNNSYDNLPEVSEFDTVTSTEKEENHDDILFKKLNVNAPFIVENSSVFALFGVIKITIP